MEPSSQMNSSPVVQPGGRHSKKWPLLLVALIVASVIAGVYILSAQRQSAKHLAASPAQISINPDGFSPATIRVKKGQLVTWTNQDTAQHAIASDESNTELDGSETLQKDDVFSYSFDKTGTYNYHDQLYNSAFKGVIIVE